MADPNPSSDPSTGDRSPDPLATFDTELEEPEPGSGTEEPDDWPKHRWTWIAIGLAIAFALATILVARSIVTATGVEVGVGEIVTVGLIALVVSIAAFIPLRWGFWVVPVVSAAHYGLNFYNMLFTDQSVYQFVEASAIGYAVLTPAIGVVLGWVLEGIYRLVATE